MYGGAGVQTRAGGDIQVLTPGGARVYGVEGAVPPATAGVLTQGSGDIQFYARDSILLGQSRVMTTFGGSILAWSAQGDINAGRGSKTTVVYTPPTRRYDSIGNVALSPSAPATGAGIATLAPIAEVPAGDVDLYAPLGTIDAGEAGIRVSGNINIHAQQVLNAANIKAQGERRRAGGRLGQHRCAVVGQRRRQLGRRRRPGLGAARAESGAPEPALDHQRADPGLWRRADGGRGISRGRGPSPERQATYRRDGAVQVVGDGPLDATQLARLSADERKALGL